MQRDWFQTSRSLFLSIILHVFLGGIFIFSFKFSTKPTPIHKPTTNIVKAISVEKKQVELELKRLKDMEDTKKSEEKKRQKNLEKKAEEAKRKRIAEEKKLKNIKKKKEAEKKKRKEEEKKLKKLEKERKELEKKKKIELEKKKKIELEKKKKEAARKRKEEEKKLKEKALQEELEAEQLQYDQSEISKHISLINSAIKNKFNITNLKEGLSCKIFIRLSEDGKVLESTIIESSGNELFDQRAEKAVYSASPLPVPSETRLFNNNFRRFNLIFEP